jgi:DNA-binding SARP family transcriptional activator
VEFRILGPLEVLAGDRAVAVPGAKPRAMLALLVLNANRSVTAEQLATALWGEEAPAGAVNTVQVNISRVRKALGDPAVLVTTPGGYELRADPEDVDALRFDRLVAQAREQRDPARAAEILEQALAMWRGAPLADVAYEPFAQREIARLEERRAAAAEELLEAKLALGRHAEVAGEAEALIDRHPYRERLHAQRMLALYRSDRQAEALQAYQDARRLLVDELGIEPGERLRELERAILAQDPSLAAPAHKGGQSPFMLAPAEVEPAAPAAPTRRTVSIVFADIVGSTGLAERLDPESMHDVLGRYYDACAAVIERHGGAVEGFIGDAVVGVFGQAEVHEDDALRAVRAAIEMRDAGGALSAALERERGTRLGMKLGLEAGEVFVGDGPRRERFAAGDAFNVAARLEGSAQDGEILLGERIHALVRDAVRAEPLEPLALEGRRAAVHAWRLLAVEPEPRRHLTAFVDRRSELAAIRAAFEAAQTARRAHAVTVVGPPGIGKSRLARELIGAVGDAATVAVGRCPSYGEAVTYRPLAEIVAGLGGSERLGELLDERLADVVRGAIGLADGPAQAEETFLAVRRMLEEVAAERPLLVVVDDIHWAEATLLDLLEHVLALSGRRAILLLCLSRPDLLESRPSWAAPQPGRTLLMLEPLPDEDARTLVAGVEPDVAKRIVETAEGNPLFLEQLVAVGAGEGELPPTIQAVLDARLARLAPAERELLEQASVEGRIFHAGALEGERLDERLVSLVRKGLVAGEGGDAFRFAHVLIREAAYRALPKQRRAELHERLARSGGPDETVGHHLAEAHRNRVDLAPAGEPERTLAHEAAGHLAVGADAALLRGDPAAGARLLERAVALLEDDPPERAELLSDLGAALFETGRIADAARVLDDAIAGAPDARARARALVERENVRLEADPAPDTARARRVTNEALPALAGDDHGLCRLWFLRGQLANWDGREAEAEHAWREATALAERTGARREARELIGWRVFAAAFGPMPAAEAIGFCEALRERARASPVATATTLDALALLHAMAGDLERARRHADEAQAIRSEPAGFHASISHLPATMRMLAGEPEIAEALLRGTARAVGEGGTLATTYSMLARAVHMQGSDAEAADLCEAARRLAADDDLLTQAGWRGVLARVLAAEGRRDEAEALAREAVAVLEPTDMLSHNGDALMDLAAVLAACGRREESDAAARDARALYERKGNVTAIRAAGAR